MRLSFLTVKVQEENCNCDENLETEAEQRLSSSGWDDRAVAIVLDPELEIWVWSDSPEVDDVLGWRGRIPRLADGCERKDITPAARPS